MGGTCHCVRVSQSVELILSHLFVTEMSGDDTSDTDVLEQTLTPGGEVMSQTRSTAASVCDISREEPDSFCNSKAAEINVSAVPKKTDKLDISPSIEAANKMSSKAAKVNDNSTACITNASIEDRRDSALSQTTDVVSDETPPLTNMIPTDANSGTVTHRVAAPGGVLAGWNDCGLKVPTLTLYEDVNLDVFVTEVVSPSLFWIQPLSSKLEEMMAELM